MYRPLVKVHLWSGLRALAGGQAAVELRAGTIGQMLDALVKEYPGLEAAVDTYPRRPVYEFSTKIRLFQSSSASRMRGGDIGNCVNRTPTALDTALAIAASGGQIEVSPTPRTP